MAQRVGLVLASKKLSFPAPSFRSLRAYLLVTKPAMVSLLVFTGVVGYALASHGTLGGSNFVLLALSLILSCAGANTLTCYVDRDIDAVMERTRNRPIPAMDMAPRSALAFGAALCTAALVAAAFVNAPTVAIILAGIIDNVLIYSLWTKRRTPLSIFAGGIAGGLPFLAGYAAYAGTVTIESLFLAALVVLWIPVHIWSIAITHREDYLRARVPMLPVVATAMTTARLIGGVAVLLVLATTVPALMGWFGRAYVFGTAFLGAMLLLLSLWLALNPTEKRAWAVSKASSAYLGLLFLSVLVDLAM